MHQLNRMSILTAYEGYLWAPAQQVSAANHWLSRRWNRLGRWKTTVIVARRALRRYYGLKRHSLTCSDSLKLAVSIRHSLTHCLSESLASFHVRAQLGVAGGTIYIYSPPANSHRPSNVSKSWNQSKRSLLFLKSHSVISSTTSAQEHTDRWQRSTLPHWIISQWTPWVDLEAEPWENEYEYDMESDYDIKRE